MIGSLSLRDVAQANGVGGEWSTRALRAVQTDSRQLAEGDLFVALRGEQFDGHDFLRASYDAGAAGAVVECAADIPEWPQIQVEDSLRALGRIGGLNRRRFDGRVIAITGSCGKTTTKNMLAEILSGCGPTLATRGNYNNEIGVPLTLLNIDEDHRFAVVEMGARRAGDIRYLTDFAQPNIVMVTNAREAHLAGFGSLQGVVSSKGEIYEGLGSAGVAVINADEPGAAHWRQQAGDARIIDVSLSDSSAAVYASAIRHQRHGAEFMLHASDKMVPVTLTVSGDIMVVNALMAAAAAAAAGASLQQIADGLAGFSPEGGRMQRSRWGETDLIDDSYNANPASVKAAIDHLVNQYSQGVLVLGDMADLGDTAAGLHREVAAYAAASGLPSLLVCGEFAQLVTEAFGEGAKAFPDKASLVSYLRQYAAQWDAVLVKGSRSTGMNEVVEALQSTSGGDS